METKDATEDGWIMPSNTGTLLIKVSNKSLNTHILQFKVYAINEGPFKVKSFTDSLMSLPETMIH